VVSLPPGNSNRIPECNKAAMADLVVPSSSSSAATLLQAGCKALYFSATFCSTACVRAAWALALCRSSFLVLFSSILAFFLWFAVGVGVFFFRAVSVASARLLR
jgi:hypothetical protein